MTLEEAYEKATALCAKRNVSVEFTFNGWSYKVKPHRLGRKIADQAKEIAHQKETEAELREEIAELTRAVDMNMDLNVKKLEQAILNTKAKT